MKGLHQISEKATGSDLLSVDDLTRFARQMRDTPLQPYQRDWYTYLGVDDRFRYRAPAYFLADPLVQLTAERDVDTQRVLDRLIHQRTALLAANLPLDDYALKVTRAESHALHYLGYIREGEVALFYGIRLVVAE